MTPNACRATTSPYGNLERPFNLAELAIAAGATFVGRTTTYHTKLLTDLIIEGYKNNGFSLIEVVTHCPTSFGRHNKMGSPADMLKWQRDHGVTALRYENLESRRTGR
ncbi:MAG: hypothetical protein ACOY3U_03035 [Bacillota bacterium]|uniref:hypothetical protein n=1 Tax=Desulforamulus profundi TaxID=1383067 RepID=UPI001EE5B987|nr:hypothetical protein [Desulforamulus profundi]